MQPGFASPVPDSQACFRAVLDAMARPGQVHRVTSVTEAPPGLDTAAAAMLLTLADADTPVQIDGAAAAWLAFHCGAPTTTAGDASFAVLRGAFDPAAYHAGTDDAPEDGATVLLQIAALGRGTAYTLAGPGLAVPATLWAEGLPPGFAAAWAANAARFPRGVDIILCAGDQLAALPRTVRITET